MFKIIYFFNYQLFISLSIIYNNKRGNNKKIFINDVISRIFIEFALFILIYDSYFLYDYNTKLYYLIYYMNPITSHGLIKILMTVYYYFFIFRSLYFIWLNYLCFYKPFFLLNDKLAKICLKFFNINLSGISIKIMV